MDGLIDKTFHHVASPKEKEDTVCPEHREPSPYLFLFSFFSFLFSFRLFCGAFLLSFSPLLSLS